MGKIITALTTLVFAVVTVTGIAMSKEGPEHLFKAGETIYVCGCGAGCDCGTVGSKVGKCACSKELVKTTVSKAEKGKVFYMVNGKEFSAPSMGKYICECGAGCGCGMISQKPGKCACGKPMKKID
jgi:hypothetical protein